MVSFTSGSPANEGLPGRAQAIRLGDFGVGGIRPVPLPTPGPEDVVVGTFRPGISRGTGMLVCRGGVPASQYAAMCASFQEGDFPVRSSAALSTGVVEHGPPELRGRTVFCHLPAPVRLVVPARSVVVVLGRVPVDRAVTGDPDVMNRIAWCGANAGSAAGSNAVDPRPIAGTRWLSSRDAAGHPRERRCRPQMSCSCDTVTPD